MKWSYPITLGVGIAIGSLGHLALVAEDSDAPLAQEKRASRSKMGTIGSALPGSISSVIEGGSPAELFDENCVLRKARPSDTELRSYIEKHEHSRDAVIAAALLSKDIAFLIDAAERFPDDPQVQLMVIERSLFESSAEKLPGEKAEWVERFKNSQPDNLLASMLLGSDLLVRGENEEGLEELRVGSGQSAYRNFVPENSLLMEEALLELGHTPLEAKVASGFGDPLAGTTDIQHGIVVLHNLIEAADSAEAKVELASLGAAIGNQLTEGDGGGWWVNQMFGLRMEKGFLSYLDPDLVSESFAGTPGEMIDTLGEEMDELKGNAITSDEFFARFPQLDGQQLMRYFDRRRVLGDMAANAWLAELWKDR